MDNFIAVHTLEMEPVLVRAGAIAYVTEIDGSAQIFFSGDSDKPLTDEELLEYLFVQEVESLNDLPLPGNSPYLSETGVVFLYTQYEIAPYSSGIITFEIPFKDILPFLTPEARNLIP